MTADESQADRAARLLREVRESDDVRTQVRELYGAGCKFTAHRGRFGGTSIFVRSRDPQAAWSYYTGHNAVVVLEVLAGLSA